MRRHKVHSALLWLIQNNPHYSDVKVHNSALCSLPENGVPFAISTVDADSDISSDEIPHPDQGPLNEEDVVYNKSTEMSSFLPVGRHQKQEVEAIRNQISGKEPLNWPSHEDSSLNEYNTPFLATLAFPTLFPDGEGDPTNPSMMRNVPLSDGIKHLLKYAEIIGSKWVYRFASHPRFSYWAFDMLQRGRTLQQSGIFLKQNPSEAHLTIDELKQIAANNNSATFMSKVSRYVANISGTNAYWHNVKENLKAIVTAVGTPSISFTFSSADMHWSELHDMLGSNTPSHERRQNVINNPHIVDWFFTKRLESFIKYWLYNTLDAKWHWYRFEYQGRGSIHCHGIAKLKNDPGLCELTNIALKGYLAEKLKNESNIDPTPELGLEIAAVNKASETVCQYVDWLLTTVNPNPPEDNIWQRPQIHPCQKKHKDIVDCDIESDYCDLLNMVQRHTRCSTGYCLRKQGEKEDLKCRFNFPIEHCSQTKLEFQQIHSKSKEIQYRAKIITRITRRNNARLNSNQQLQLQGWRANCDIQVVIDRHACFEYLAKYAAKGEPRSPLLKSSFNSIVNNAGSNSNPLKAIKK